MSDKQQSLQKTTNTNSFTFKQIIRLQLIWYMINFLIVFGQNNVNFDLPYFNNLYQVSFKIIGRSFFISILLYIITTRNIEFSDLGLSRKNFLTQLNLGLEFSGFLLGGLIISNIALVNCQPLVKITSPEQLATSLFYFGLVFMGLLIPAFSKELFYRGLLYYFFKQKKNRQWALVLTTIYYTISYLDFRPASLIVHFLVGIITTYLYYKTENLIAPTIFQTVYQAGLTVYLFSFSHWPF